LEYYWRENESICKNKNKNKNIYTNGNVGFSVLGAEI
jgi:hypothetical protein